MPTTRIAFPVLFALAMGCGNSTDFTDMDDATVEPPVDAVFRVTSIHLRDPHVFLDIATFCNDITDTGIGLNTSIQQTLDADDGNGNFLNSLLLRFRPLDPTTSGGEIEAIQGATCRTTDTTCTLSMNPVVTPFTDANGQQVARCAGVVPGTLRPYAPAVVEPAGPCFSTEPQDFTVDLVGIPFGLEAVRIHGHYQGTPITDIVDGLLVGFLPELATALATTLPQAIPLVGGMPLASLLPGGLGSCDGSDDRDVGPDGQTMGWWVYFQFTATRVELAP